MNNNQTDASALLVTHYSHAFQKHGANASGVDWGSKERHQLRLNAMFEKLSFNKAKDGVILDIGCGYGELVTVLKDYNIPLDDCYVGVEPCQEMVHSARELHPGYDFRVGYIESFQPNFAVGCVFCCGVFTKKLSLNDNDMYRLIRSFFKQCEIWGASKVIFNVMSPLCDFKDDQLFYPEFGNLMTIISEIWGYDVVSFNFGNDYLKYETYCLLKIGT